MRAHKLTNLKLVGTPAKDRMFGGTGDDTLVGDKGNDFLVGASGVDTAVFSGLLKEYELSTHRNGNVIVKGPDGRDALKGVEILQFADAVVHLATWDFTAGRALHGTGDKDRLRGGLGDDTIVGGAGNDRLFGNGGMDTAVFSGSFDMYTITKGRNGFVFVQGPDGRDVLSDFEFLQFDDRIIDLQLWDFDAGRVFQGSDGRDRLQGGRGNDTLVGGLSNDRLLGGAGQDTAVFSGTLSDYDITQARNGRIIVQGPDGRDALSDIEFLQFDDHSIDISTWNFTGNNAPLTNPVSVQMEESPDVMVQTDAGAQIVGNIGLWYVFDFDTGAVTTAVRSNTETPTTQDAADLYLSNGNGLILHPNGNSSGWVFWAASFAEGVETKVAVPDIIVTDTDGGDMHQKDARWVSFGDNNQLVEAITVRVLGIELADGRVIDVEGRLSNIDYEVARTDDLSVENATFRMVTSPKTPGITITADVYDPEGDALVFALDTALTKGRVTDNGDGTFLYDPGEAFEGLNSGETATDSFGFSVDDGAGGLSFETVTVTINGVDEIFV